MIRFTKCSGGFGLLGIIILAAVIASAAFGGGMYWRETKKQQSLLQMGADAKKRAEELKQAIESRDKQIFGSPTSEDTDVENEIPLYSDLEWVSPKQELDPYHGSWNGSVVYSRETKSDMESEFFRFYDSELKLRGWQKNLLDADSPRGRVSGYMKESDHLFLGVERKNLSAISDRPFTCPCERIYSIWSDANIRFINQTDTSDWKTYRNEKYGFEFKYPKDWDLSYPEGTIYGETVPMNAPLVTKGPAAEIQAWILPNSDWGGTFSGLNNHVDFELQYAKSYIEGNDPYPFEIFEEAKDNWAIVSREKITVFGRESIKIKFKKDKDKSSILVNIPYKKTSMVFALKMRVRVDNPKLDSVMVGIISSLKFL